MDWGIDFSGELRKMKEDMDRAWSSLFEEKRDEREKGENPKQSEQTRKT